MGFEKVDIDAWQCFFTFWHLANLWYIKMKKTRLILDKKFISFVLGLIFVFGTLNPSQL